jgi:hypothetical protein
LCLSLWLQQQSSHIKKQMKPRLGKIKSDTTMVDWIRPSTHTELNSRRRKKTLAGQNGTSTRATQAEAQHRTHAKPPSNHKPVTTLHRQQPNDRAVRTKTPSSVLAPSLSTLSYTEVACCRARQTVVVHCKPKLLLVLTKPTPSTEIQAHTL